MPQFRAKARAVELLGKGQIADLPTAITELWKNGYDAYAKNLECKLYLESYKQNTLPLFVLSDDGFGMTETDIMEKWLVLGTDSKSRGGSTTPYFGLGIRPPMGEKGIGRLSVSYLGNTMIMLSKKQNEPAQALFMDWRVLENYNYYLSDLTIPLFNFSSIDDFKNKFQLANKEFHTNLQEEKWKEQAQKRNEIYDEIINIKIPDYINEEIVQPFLNPEHHGTSFIVFNPNYQLLEISEKDRIDLSKDATVNYFRASLSGLHNDLNDSKKDFETHFYIYNKNGKYDLIDDFFTKEEMEQADHWLKGKFNEFGFFEGEIRIFNQRFKHTFKPIKPAGLSSYGPFTIEWGFIEGSQKNSLLTEDQYRNIDKKLEQFGGLYLYRDNFRVLPYGRPDYDFLEFETRRSKRAGEYFFSHRRFIGYIDISRENNYGLKDKAGREGFIQNKAYRDFRDDLVAFFIDIALKYLKTDSQNDENTSREEQIKEIQAKFEKQKEAEKRKNANTKKAFLLNLENNKNSVQSLKQEILALNKDLNTEATNIEINFNNYNRLLTILDEKKATFRNLKLNKPKGAQYTKKQEESFFNYQKEYEALDSEFIKCISIVDETRKKINEHNLRLEYKDTFNNHLKRLENIFGSYNNILKNSIEVLKGSLKQEKEKYKNEFIEQTNNIQISESDSKEELVQKIKLLNVLCEEQDKTIHDNIGGFIDHIQNLNIEVDDDFLRSWYKEQKENLEKKLEDYEELAQLGMSIEIIDHQFNVMYSQLKDSISNVKKYAQKNTDLEYTYKQLEGAFQHLEGNYKLLAPLYRTSRRSRAIINGGEIENYIRSFFQSEFERFKIDFDVNDAFRKYEFFTFDSIIKPIFLNLINNANYWLLPVEDRKIKIECNNDEILIMNSGERIDDVHIDDIFTLFFTRKSDGRGIGLYLAKKNLSSIGYEIFASNDKKYNKLKGACFIIKKIQRLEE